MKEIEKSLKYIDSLIAETEEKSFLLTKELIFRIENEMAVGKSIINDIMELNEEIESLKKFYDRISDFAARHQLELDDCNHYVVREKE